ncbi:MAG: PEGA domain-containing protein [Lentisphaerae bacterium]|nr:PEGA domain-containing protein [Lentisphaerota bacterium]
MRLRIAEGREVGRVLTLEPKGLSIGRGRDNDLQVVDEGVSRHHCRICQAGEAWLIEDLNSVNGVSVNGTRVEGTRTLMPGDQITLCRHVMVVEDDDADLVTLPPTRGAAAGAAPAAAAETPPAMPPVETPPPLAAAVTPAAEPAAMPAAGAAAAEPLWDDEELPPRRWPWVRLVLLGVIVAAIAALAFRLFSGGETPSTAEPAATTTDAAAPTEVPREVSDADLAKLIAAEEQAPTAAGAAGAAGTPPAGAATAALEDDPDAAPDATAGAPAGDRAPAVEAGRAVVSDLVFVASEPAGATVVIDGREAGTTPVLLRDLSRGRHRIELRLEGYESFERQIHVPDLLPSRPYTLRPRPGTLAVTSTVPGTAIWRGPQFLGVAPTLLVGLPEGSHELLFAAPACEPLRQTVTISAVSGEQLQVTPAPQLGILEVVTQPAGCAVVVQSGLKGVTQPGDDGTALSAPLRLENLAPGTYPVAVEHPSGVSIAGRLAVKPGETTRQLLRLWVPDARVLLTDGTVKTGMVMERNAQGDVVLAETPRQLERYLKPQIANTVPLTPEETAEILRKLGLLSAPKTDAKPAERGDTKPRPRDEAERRGAAAENPAAAEAVVGWGDQPAATTAAEKPAADDNARARRDGTASAFSVDDLNDLMRREASMEVSRRLRDRTIAIRGKPTSIGKEGPNSYVAFGRRIRCYIDRDDYEANKERLRKAVDDDKGAIEISGTSSGIRGDVLVLRDCKARDVEPPPAPNAGR